jgi:hypothetical protein
MNSDRGAAGIDIETLLNEVNADIRESGSDRDPSAVAWALIRAMESHELVSVDGSGPTATVRGLNYGEKQTSGGGEQHDEGR